MNTRLMTVLAGLLLTGTAGWAGAACGASSAADPEHGLVVDLHAPECAALRASLSRDVANLFSDEYESVLMAFLPPDAQGVMRGYMPAFSEDLLFTLVNGRKAAVAMATPQSGFFQFFIDPQSPADAPTVGWVALRRDGLRAEELPAALARGASALAAQSAELERAVSSGQIP